jgi:4-amino-4-deoxy-L-arabinose transferase-like glycosyltransferase
VTVTDTNSKNFRAPWLIFWVGFLVRVLYITLAHTYRVRLTQDHFQFGWEMGRIARALVTGYGYADPFVGHTGPTAWVPPLYPLLLAAIFKLFGVYSALSAWVILTINSVFSAATALFVYEIAARCYNQRVAVWSAWLWALYPAALQYAVHWIWEMSLTAMLFTWILVLALRMRSIGEASPDAKAQSTGRWLLFGALWGLIALSNATLLLFLPVCDIWIVQPALRSRIIFRNAALASIVFLSFITPWLLRNWNAFHAFIPMRSNLGVELWAWNNQDANAISLGAPIQPSAGDQRFLAYSHMGELAYSRYCGALAKAWISSHPMQFMLLSIKRFYFYWVSVPHPIDNKPLVEYGRELNYCLFSLTGLMGLALSIRKRIPASGLFAFAFLLLPLTYYFVSVAARFRHPLEPLIAIFTVYLFQSARRRRAVR